MQKWETKAVNCDPLSCLAGADLSEVVLNSDLIRATTNGGRMLRELSEEDCSFCEKSVDIHQWRRAYVVFPFLL